MFGTALWLVAMAFAAVWLWKLALIVVSLGRLRTVSIRRRPLATQAIRGHTLHLLVAGVGIALVLLADRLPGDIHVYVPQPPSTWSPSPTSTESVSFTPSPSPPTPPGPVPRAMHLRRLPFEPPPFGPGLACDDDRDGDRIRERQVAIDEAAHELAERYRSQQLQFVLVVGTFDHTSLSPATSRRYDSNTALAQERAECVARLLSAQLQAQVEGAGWADMLHTMVAGPQHARSRNPDEKSRGEDRGVRILVGADATNGGKG